MGSGSVKLFKIASEINIGKDAIVEYLQSKGYDIQNKPTATLNEKMVDVVMDKFKKEKRAAEIQREKIQKHKDIRVDVKKEEKPATPSEKVVHTAAPAFTKTTVSAHSTEVEHVKHDDIIDSVAVEQVEPQISEVQVIEEKAPIAEPETPTSKVDTEEINITEPVVTIEAIPEKSVETAATTIDLVVSAEEKVVEVVNPEPVHTIEQSTHEVITEHIYEEVILDRTEEDKVEKVIVIDEPIKQVENEEPTEIDDSESYEQDDSSDSANETNDDVSDASNKASQDKKRERRKKKKKPQQETEPGESPQLKGLTVLGKINLTPPEPEKPVRPERRPHKPEGNKDADSRPSKFKKRKHNKATEASPEQQQQQQPTTAPGTGRVIPGLIREKDRVKLAETQTTSTSADLKSKFKDSKDAKPVKEVEKEDRKKRKRKKTIREMISQEEVDRAIKETLSGMDGSAFTSQRAKLRMKKRIEREEKEQKIKDDADRESKILKLSEFVTTGDLANLMNINSGDIILKCMELGLMVTINQRLDKDTITLIADDYNFEVDFLDEKEIQFVEDDVDEDENLTERPPIVTIMGHVDHGKTSLLDHIRNANVVAGEAGGITQHIGAYKVILDSGKSITFLDTPGHEAFTAMRARGAQVTDIVILVVAADDSVMPQTIEAISHARAANVPIIVAINKIDKVDSNPDRIRQQLADHGVLVEEWGGKFQAVEISAKQGLNIDKLMEKVLIEAELLDLKANVERLARGIVIESNMKKGWGATATIIVQKGTLKVGDAFVTGIHSGKVRALLNERENKIDETGPSSPVMVIGFDGLPEVGDTFIVSFNDAEARTIANERKQLRREQDMRKVRHMTLDQISEQIMIGGVKELNLVIKGDVAGSVEALSDSLQKLSRDEVRVLILHKGVGPITETDVMLAAASNAVVLGFNVNPTGKARKAAENEMVDIRHYDIIYDCINEIQLALEGLLTPEYKEEITATVEVRKTFKVSRTGTIAGCYVKSGKILRNDKIRVLRDGLLEFEGSISSLKRGKDDVRDVDTGFECGIQLAGFNDIIEGDIIESFKMIEIKRKFK